MADKRISQLIERTDIANNDVLPIVASGATTTNKVTISTIQDWMQDNLDVGVTSVGITLGTTGTDVNVSGSPITTSGNITINIPDASASARGVVTTGTQTFAGNKSFQNTIFVNAGLRLDQNGTALPTFVQNISGTGLISSGSNGLGFNSANNLYFSGSEKGGAVLAVNNSAVRTYTLQDANGTLAFTSDLSGYVTLGTAQTITGQKTFNSTIVGQDATLTSSGSNPTLLVTHSSGSGIALDISKGGNGEGLRVAKTSGSGNAVTITGGTLSAEAGQFSGDLQTSTRISATSGSNAITITPNVGGTQNRIETTGTLPLALVSAAAITLAAGGTTPQITLATTGAVTLTGALNGTSASFTGDLTSNGELRVSNNAGLTFLQLVNSSAGGRNFTLISSGASNPHSVAAGNFYLRNSTTGTNPLLIDGSTGAATFSSSVTATGNAATTSALYVNNGVGASGTAQYYAEFGNGAGFVGTRFFRGNGISGLAGGGMTIDSFDGFGIRLNQLGGSGGTFNITGGNVGIGTASPKTITNGLSLTIGDGGTQTQPYLGLARNATGGFFAGINFYDGNTIKSYIQEDADFNLRIGTSNTERLRITSSGNVGIGTASPVSLSGYTSLSLNGSTGALFNGQVNGVSASYFGVDPDSTFLYELRNKFLGFGTNNTERMRITSGGALLVSTQSSSGIATGSSVNQGVDIGGGVISIQTNNNSNNYWSKATGYTSGDFTAHFVNGNYVGGISTNGSTTTYAIASDYRLKEDFQEINGIEKVQAIKVYDYKWKESEDRMDGVIAHELQEVLPYAVVGEKDAERMQSVDYSKIVPVLIKAIQELKTEIDSLKNQMK